MLNRHPFWLGLFLGTFAAFRLRLPKPRPQPPSSTDFRDLIADALIVCDSTGTVTETNTAAQTLFGASCLSSLCYLTGQAVPPGQQPLRRAALSREAISGLYRLTTADGTKRVLDVLTRPLPDGRTAAVFRDVTAQYDGEEQARAAQAQQEVLRTLCRRLGQSQTAAATAQAVAEETRRLLSAVPDVQIRLYEFNPQTDTLTCLASVPEDRPKRPASAAQAQPLTVRFDAQVPEFWQMYVTRKPSPNGLPLIAGGAAVGHLAVSSSAGSVVEDPALRETLELIALLAASALTGPSASAQTAALTAQAAAVREITRAVSSGREQSAVADLVTRQIKRLLSADICTVSLFTDGKLSVLGQAFIDDLVLPQTVATDPRLHGKAVQKARRTQKMVVQTGIANPSFEDSPWRAYAGSTGQHTLTALPLADKRGVLTVYTPGDLPLPEPQIKFLETLAALVSLSLITATASRDISN